MVWIIISQWLDKRYHIDLNLSYNKIAEIYVSITNNVFGQVKFGPSRWQTTLRQGDKWTFF